jgi:hypothetical protein
MSKDKGSKNNKKAPADKSGKSKEGSDYKNEGKTSSKNGVADTFHPKATDKTGKSA